MFRAERPGHAADLAFPDEVNVAPELHCRRGQGLEQLPGELRADV